MNFQWQKNYSNFNICCTSNLKNFWITQNFSTTPRKHQNYLTIFFLKKKFKGIFRDFFFEYSITSPTIGQNIMKPTRSKAIHQRLSNNTKGCKKRHKQWFGWSHLYKQNYIPYIICKTWKEDINKSHKARHWYKMDLNLCTSCVLLLLVSTSVFMLL